VPEDLRRRMRAGAQQRNHPEEKRWPFRS
jgi:hypothetical protein